MGFHKLLEKQIRKYLSDDFLENESFKMFIQSINDSYISFERDKELMDHSFKESEKEYQEVNQNLKKEHELKQQSISNLYDSLEILEENYQEINPEDDVDDLLFISKYLNKQIEKRKEIEKNLYRTVELLKTLIANLHSGILVEDENRKILFSNQLFCNLLSIPVPHESLVGVDCTNSAEESKKLFKDSEFFSARIDSILAQKKIVVNELLETIDGRFLERNYIPVFIENEYKGHLWRYTDVTERIQNQILLEQSEERSRIVMNASLNAIITVDDKAKVTFWNREAEVIFGWKKEEVIGKIFTDFMVPERNKDLWSYSISQYLNEGYNEYLNKQIELIGVKKSGSEFLAEISIIPITQNGEVFFSAFLQDISQRKESEMKLLETLELLKTLLANLPSGIMVEDMNHTVIFTNQLFCDITNIETSPDKTIGQSSNEITENSKLLFKDSEYFSKRIAEIVGLKEVVVGELIETHMSTFFERDYIPIVVDNKCKGHLWKYTNITQRIQNQFLLEQSEERSRNIMNASLNAIITIDAKGKISFWNNQAEVIFGWKEEEVIGKLLTETIIPRHYHKGHTMGMKHYFKTGEGPVLNKQVELVAVNKCGEEFPIEISIIPLKQYNEVFFCSFIQDISERKKAEANLRLQEKKYRNIIANMNLGLVEVDNNEVIQYVNQSFATMSGFEIMDLLGKNPSEIFVFGENFDIVNSKKQLRKRGLSDVYQLPIKNKKGEIKWWAIGGAPNYDDSGNLIGSIGIHLDITEQKQLEIELEKQKTMAEEGSKAKEAFLANMSHEIRTPLNVIIGFLRELDKQKLSSLQKICVDNSIIASKHLLAVLNNILDISKIEAGEMSLEKKDFNFEYSINNVIKVFRSKAKEKGLYLKLSISEDISKVFQGDSLRLEQVLFNLVANALKFTERGTVFVKCELISSTRKYQEICISVIDTGIGMDEDFRESIFRKFSQEDIETTRKFGGTGLGLAITKELVDLMGGKIVVETMKDKGTSFHITIKLVRGSFGIVEKRQSEISFDINGLCILLVEDNEMNRIVVKNCLRNFKCEILEAENGLQALEILKYKNFDIILMDIQMPEMDGIEATKIIRNQLKLLTPVIALSANAFKSDIDKFKAAGMNDYIIKPFDEVVLFQTIARYTDKKAHVIENLYNLKMLEDMSRGNSQFVVKMITIFVRQTSEILEKMEQALVERDFLETGRLVHKIMPSVDNMGMVIVKQELKVLENFLNNNADYEQVFQLFCSVKDSLVKVIKQLRENELIF